MAEDLERGWVLGYSGEFETDRKGTVRFQMDEELKIVYKDTPAWEIIGGGITNYNRELAGDDGEKRLCFVVQGPSEEILGGIIGATYWDWFYVSLMWLKEEFRGRGYGHRMEMDSLQLKRD